AGTQAQWFLDAETAGVADPARFAPDAFTGSPGPQTLQAFWDSQVRQLGDGWSVKDVDESTNLEVKATVASADGREWALSCSVELPAPHKIQTLIVSPTLSGFEGRQATDEDAAALARIELETPIVLGDPAFF